MILGVGVDIIEVQRIDAALRRHGERFLRRVFTDDEVAVCTGRRQEAPCFAARFAVKEAVMKALGCGWGPIGWRDIEVERAANGKPTVRLEGAAARLANNKGVDVVHISLAHVERTAIAYAVAWGPGPGTDNVGGESCES